MPFPVVAYTSDCQWSAAICRGFGLLTDESEVTIKMKGDRASISITTELYWERKNSKNGANAGVLEEQDHVIIEGQEEGRLIQVPLGVQYIDNKTGRAILGRSLVADKKG